MNDAGSPPGTQRVVVLMYHRIGTARNDWERKYCVEPARFAQHMHALARAGMQSVSLQDFFQWLAGRVTLPERSFVLTFDDGFLGVYQHAAPVLRELRWPATVFLVSGLIGGHDEWSRAENPDGIVYPLMDVTQIRDLRHNGFSYQSHTRRHPDLTTLSDTELRDELERSRLELEALVEAPVSYLAYPFGRYNDHVIEAARATGYRAALSTQPGFNRSGVDPFRIRRLDIFGSDSAANLMRKVHFGSNDGSVAAVLSYYGTRLAAQAKQRSATFLK